MPNSAVTAFILAGGKSTRMGTDKAFVALDGRTLLARSLDLARSVATDVHVVGDPAKCRRVRPDRRRRLPRLRTTRRNPRSFACLAD